MNKNKKILFFFLVLFSLGALAWATMKTQSGEPQSPQKTVPMVQVQKGSFDIAVHTIGALDASEAHTVASSLRGSDGKIIWLIDDGSKVQQGDILVKLDPVPFEEEIQQLIGEISKFEAAIEAKKQLLEWEKSQAAKELSTAAFKVKNAKIELSKFQQGEGPLTLIQYKEEREKIQKDIDKYQRYSNDLKELQKKGFNHPGEIAKAEQELHRLQGQYKDANRKLESYQDYLLPATIERLESDVAQAQMEEEQAKKASIHKIGQAQSSYNEIQAILSNTRHQKERAAEKLTQTIIRAPSDGIVVLFEAFRNGQKRKPRLGDVVLQNQPILYLPDVSTMLVKTKIREIDLHKVTIGQTCSVTVDAYPKKKLSGRVSFIGALASEREKEARNARYFQLTITLVESDPALRPGMTARINILADQVKDRIIIPAHALFERNGVSFCYKLVHDVFEKVPVQTGRENEDFIEILSGLKTGDWLSSIQPDLTRP